MVQTGVNPTDPDVTLSEPTTEHDAGLRRLSRRDPFGFLQALTEAFEFNDHGVH
jgi:hypothetical protein